jgi:hypothetical protein
MVLGVDNNPRFVLFSIIASAIFTFIIQNLDLLLHFTLVNPLYSWIEFLIIFVFFFNVIYALATYEIEEDENTIKAYIIVIIGLIIGALFLYYVGPIISNIFK